MSELLNKFLSKEPQQRNKCSICARPEIAEVVNSHLNKLLAGTTTITLRRVHDGLLLPEFDYPKSFDTIRDHVKRCLRRNVKTGEEL